jgi:hypothetical protein
MKAISESFSSCTEFLLLLRKCCSTLRIVASYRWGETDLVSEVPVFNLAFLQNWRKYCKHVQIIPEISLLTTKRCSEFAMDIISHRLLDVSWRMISFSGSFRVLIFGVLVFHVYVLLHYNKWVPCHHVSSGCEYGEWPPHFWNGCEYDE